LFRFIWHRHILPLLLYIFIMDAQGLRKSFSIRGIRLVQRQKIKFYDARRQSFVLFRFIWHQHNILPLLLYIFIMDAQGLRKSFSIRGIRLVQHHQ
jgi:hypothetical protein